MIMTYNLGKPMDWETFKAIPHDIQEEYLERLRKKYNVSYERISDMFGVHQATLYRFLNKEGLKKSYAGKMSDGQKEAWNSVANQNKTCNAPKEDVKNSSVVELASAQDDSPCVKWDAFKPVLSTKTDDLNQYAVTETAPNEVEEVKEEECVSHAEPKRVDAANMPCVSKLGLNLSGKPSEILLGLEGAFSVLSYDSVFEVNISVRAVN